MVVWIVFREFVSEMFTSLKSKAKGTRNDLSMDEDARLAYPVSWAACVVLMERRDISSGTRYYRSNVAWLLPGRDRERKETERSGVIKRILHNWKLCS